MNPEQQDDLGLNEVTHSRSSAFLATLYKVVNHLLSGDREDMRSLVAKGMRKLAEIKEGYGPLLLGEANTISGIDILGIGRRRYGGEQKEWQTAGGLIFFPPEITSRVDFSPSAIPTLGSSYIQTLPENDIAVVDGPTFIKAFTSVVAPGHKLYLSQVMPRDFRQPAFEPEFYFEMPADGLVIDGEIFVPFRYGKAEYERAALVSLPGEDLRIINWQDALRLQQENVKGKKKGILWGTPFYFDSDIKKREIKAGMRALGDDTQFSSLIELWDGPEKNELKGRLYINLMGVDFDSYIAFCLAVAQKFGAKKGLKSVYCVGAMLEKTGSDAVVSDPVTQQKMQVPVYNGDSIHKRNGHIVFTRPFN
jgi:hypothetical protein